MTWLCIFFWVVDSTELWINGKLTDYAQAATKQHRIVAGCANSDADDMAAAEMKKQQSQATSVGAILAKKDREVKDSATQPQSFVSTIQVLSIEL